MARLMKVTPARVDRLQARFCYLYWVLWLDILLPWRWKNRPRGYVPKSPLFYIYGGRKPIQFQSEAWLAKLEAWGGDSARIDNGDHWFMESHPTETNALIREWFSRT